MTDAEQIVLDLAHLLPYSRKTFGQGDFGIICVFCEAMGYEEHPRESLTAEEPFVHKDGCVWRRAMELLS
jgi:hypothetical protein